MSLPIKKFKKTLQEKNLDAFLVSNFYNIFYLSGFRTLTENEREAWMLITSKNNYLFSDSRYINSEDKEKRLITPEKGLIKHLQEIFEEEKIKTCGIEADDLKISEFNKLKNYFPKINFIETEKLLLKQREIKDEKEIEKIKKACGIADQCLSEIIKIIKIGQTEKEIAFKIEFWLKEKGYDLAFYPIVAIDKNSSIIHYDTRNGNNKKIKKNSVILMDFGVKYQNYLSDITRMIFFGKPTDKQINVYQNLLSIQEKTLKNSYSKTTQEIDQYCRKLIKEKNLPNYPHSTGHGVGLEIHEYPKISPNSQDQLLENQVITIEPGVYFQEKWGMRIEDTVLVKKNNLETLTKFTKEPLII